MPIGKRATKIVSYNEQDDDDDDFLSSSVDTSKKNRNIKSDDIQIDSKTSKTQISRKSDEKQSKHKKKENKIIVQLPKESPVKVIVETSINRDEKENATSQSTVSTQDVKISSQQLIDVDDEEDDLSPTNKRRKYEEDDNTQEDESEHKEEEDSTSIQTIITSKTEEQFKKTEISNDHNTLRIDHRNFSTRTSDLPKKRASVPLGFPTSRINIPSPNVFRVGLSRKSATIKPLHPNLASRVVHE